MQYLEINQASYKENKITEKSPEITRYKNDNKRKISAKALIVISVLLTIFLFFVILTEIKLYPQMISLCENAAIKSSEKSIAESILLLTEKDILNYNDLIYTHYSKDGKISSISVNTKKALLMRAEFEKTLNEKLEKNNKIKVKIPFGNLLGVNILSDKGFNLSIKLTPISSSIGELKSDFESKGINQICHKLYIDAKIEIMIIMPFKAFKKVIYQKIPISENIILGEVPNYYLQR